MTRRQQFQNQTRNVFLPTVPIARLTPGDFKRMRTHSPQLMPLVDEWLRKLALHPRTPANAMRVSGQVHIYSLGAISAWPWWQVESINVNEAGMPERDHEAEAEAGDGQDLFHGIVFGAAVHPPVALIEAMDEASGQKLTNRVDGGPTPAKPRGTGPNLPEKRPVKR